MENKSKTEDYLSRLAEGVKTNPHFQEIQEWLGGRDIGEVFAPSAMGFTKQAAVREVAGKLFDPNIPTQSKQFLRGALADLLRVVGKTPKKAVAHIQKFELEPGYVTSGSYHPRSLQVYPTELEKAGQMASTFAHEAGHGGTLPMVGKIRLRQERGIPSSSQRALDVTPETIGMELYRDRPFKRDVFEGAAEYIGRHLQKQAGLTPVDYFGHGPGQQAVFEELSKMPSKNPWMNVYRYFQEVLK